MILSSLHRVGVKPPVPSNLGLGSNPLRDVDGAGYSSTLFLLFSNIALKNSILVREDFIITTDIHLHYL